MTVQRKIIIFFLIRFSTKSLLYWVDPILLYNECIEKKSGTIPSFPPRLFFIWRFCFAFDILQWEKCTENGLTLVDHRCDVTVVDSRYAQLGYGLKIFLMLSEFFNWMKEKDRRNLNNGISNRQLKTYSLSGYKKKFPYL